MSYSKLINKLVNDKVNELKKKLKVLDKQTKESVIAAHESMYSNESNILLHSTVDQHKIYTNILKGMEKIRKDLSENFPDPKKLDVSIVKIIFGRDTKVRMRKRSIKMTKEIIEDSFNTMYSNLVSTSIQSVKNENKKRKEEEQSIINTIEERANSSDDPQSTIEEIISNMENVTFSSGGVPSATSSFNLPKGKGKSKLTPAQQQEMDRELFGHGSDSGSARNTVRYSISSDEYKRLSEALSNDPMLIRNVTDRNTVEFTFDPSIFGLDNTPIKDVVTFENENTRETIEMDVNELERHLIELPDTIKTIVNNNKKRLREQRKKLAKKRGTAIPPGLVSPTKKSTKQSTASSSVGSTSTVKGVRAQRNLPRELRGQSSFTPAQLQAAKDERKKKGKK